MPEVTKIPGFLTERKPQAAAYIRVSSMMKEQEDSYENQAAYYEQKIKSNPEWKFAGIYGEQLSGTHAENRNEFHKLIQDAMDRKIDLVLCKSVSRWSRNMLDGLNAIKLLTGNGVHILFEQEGIDTRTPGVLLPLHLAQSVAQSESESTSENIKWTYKNRSREGKFWAKPGVYYGYDSKGDTFSENADADNVRFMFDRFIEGAAITQIAKELNEKGCRTVRGNEWTMDAVRRILKNEVYVGDVIFRKSPSRNVITREIDKDWKPRYVKNHHKGIVDRDVWERAQDEFEHMRERLSKQGKM